MVVPQLGKEERTKQYIKDELKRYYMYYDRVMELRKEIASFKDEYQEILNDPPIGGSIIKMPDGTPSGKNIVMRMRCKLNGLEANLEYYEDRLDTLDKWMDMLTPPLLEVVKIYVLEYQCENMHEAAIANGLSEDVVHKYTNRAIKSIYSNFKKFM